ncbi:MAG: ATP-grasp domain-containing protein [Thermodesulfobacteriota bacterium]
MSRVLVLDGNQRSALAATRSLGRKGIYVTVADENKNNLSAASKYAKEDFVYPSPYREPLDFLEVLRAETVKRGVRIIFPMTDVTTALLLEHRSAFPDIDIPFGDFSAYEMLTDKWKLFQMAQDIGIPIPRTWFIESVDRLEQAIPDLTYPVVLKPYRSRIFCNGHWEATSVRYAGSEGELRKIVSGEDAFARHPFLIQEKIQGTGQGVFALYAHGKPLVFFAHRRLREKPPSGGVSVLRESIPVDPTMQETAKRLLDRAAWHGVAMVEFKVDREGTPYLMEVNARFWGSLQLAIDAGVDFPWLLYQLATGENLNRVNSYKIGVKSRWLLGDLDHLYLTFKNSGQYPAYSKWQAIIHFLNFFEKNTRYEVNRWDDLRPFLFELKQYCSGN